MTSLLARAGRPTARWWLAVVGLLLLCAVDATHLGEPWPRPLGSLPLLVVALGTLALALRPPRRRSRWFPLAAGATAGASVAVSALPSLWDAATDPTDLISLAEVAVLLALLAVAARACDRPTAAVPVLLLALAVVAVALRAPTGGGSRGSTAMLLVLVAVVVTVVAGYTGVQARRRDAAVRASLRAERLALAADLHDLVAHHVTAVLLQTRMAQVLLVEDPAASAELLGQVEAEATRALESMRTVVGVLRGATEATPGDDLHDGGAARSPAPVLDDLVDLVARYDEAGPRARLTIDLDAVRDLPDAPQTALYRVVQEALTNVRKHAPGATRVLVEVDRAGAGLRARVRDDGPPPDRTGPVAGTGFGLLGMAERVAALGGQLTAGPVLDGPGWQVEAVVDLATTRGARP